MRRWRLYPWIGSALLCASMVCAHAAEPCGAAGWNLTHEQALFAHVPKVVRAGKNRDSAPMLATDRLYRLKLRPEQQVTFAAAPGKKMLTDGAYAGMARFKISSAGTYRVAIDSRFWIDVVYRGRLVRSADFTGERGCEPRKIVAYVLPKGRLVLQVSGQVKPNVTVSITEAPTAATSH
jgi:hypothetical protein